MAEPGKKALGADLIIPALALGFAVYFFVSIADLAWEAKANGVLIGSALVVLIVAQVIRIGVDVARGRGHLGFEKVLAPREALPKRLGIVAVAAALIGTLPWLGLTLGLFLGLLAALLVMGVRKRSRLFWIPFITAAAAYVMFIAIVRADFPHGPVEKGLARIIASVRS